MSSIVDTNGVAALARVSTEDADFALAQADAYDFLEESSKLIHIQIKRTNIGTNLNK